jgi:two-component system, OmpR family, response regulator
MNQGESRPAARILVAEDDAIISEQLAKLLRREAYNVATTRNIAGTRIHLRNHPVDLLILDLSMPDGDGIDLCRQIRGEGFAGAVMMVTARDAAVDRVLGLEFGADDYLAKPFEPRELLARIRNIFKRFRFSGDTGADKARTAYFGIWRLDLNLRRLHTRDDKIIMLSSAEFRLLRRLLDQPDKVLSREELLPSRGATVSSDRSIDLQISRLRQKLSTEPGGDQTIQTVRSEGYYLPGPVRFE